MGLLHAFFQIYKVRKVIIDSKFSYRPEYDLLISFEHTKYYSIVRIYTTGMIPIQWMTKWWVQRKSCHGYSDRLSMIGKESFLIFRGRFLKYNLNAGVWLICQVMDKVFYRSISEYSSFSIVELGLSHFREGIEVIHLLMNHLYIIENHLGLRTSGPMSLLRWRRDNDWHEVIISTFSKMQKIGMKNIAQWRALLLYIFN